MMTRSMQCWLSRRCCVATDCGDGTAGGATSDGAAAGTTGDGTAKHQTLSIT